MLSRPGTGFYPDGGQRIPFLQKPEIFPVLPDHLGKLTGRNFQTDSASRCGPLQE